MATPLPVGSSAPAADNDSGTTTHRPTPTIANPAIAIAGPRASATSAMPTAPTRPPTATGRTGPTRRTGRSAMSRPETWQARYAASPSGTTLRPECSASARYLALQFEVAESLTYMSITASPTSTIGAQGI